MNTIGTCRCAGRASEKIHHRSETGCLMYMIRGTPDLSISMSDSLRSLNSGKSFWARAASNPWKKFISRYLVRPRRCKSSARDLPSAVSAWCNINFNIQSLSPLIRISPEPSYAWQQRNAMLEQARQSENEGERESGKSVLFDYSGNVCFWSTV